MSASFTIADLAAEARALEADQQRVLTRLRVVRQLLAALKEYTESSSDPVVLKSVGPRGPASVSGASPTVATPSVQMETAQFNITHSQKPSIREAVYAVVEESPGLTTSEVVDRVLERVKSDSPNGRKVIATRIGQFVREPDSRLKRNGERLRMIEEKK